MKKIINRPENVVFEMLDGLVAANPDKIKLIRDKRIIIRKEPKAKGKVSVVTGSGSGHEPDQVWYVGKGMLDAACAGPIFAAPTADAIYEATKMVDGGAGVLYLIKNYTGDRANFSMAAEMADADGIKVETVIANDDVAVKDSTWTAGRRGVAGAILNYKITCAKAEMGANLAETKEIAERVNANLRSMGYALTSCTTPAKGSPTFELGEDEMEIGVGLHGEPGRLRTKIMPADEIIGMLTKNCIDDLPFKAGDEVAVMVNGLGGTPIMEMYIAFRKVAEILSAGNIKIYKSYIGEYCTSLDMAGCSVSLLKLDNQMKELLAFPVDIPLTVF
ncbi:MAG: dihydroxyacetone kinase subunit DhaK [Clostridiales bacterium]|nr:dihydroxyacetone kinase subunit DhaK [Clostridiales bacterium]